MDYLRKIFILYRRVKHYVLEEPNLLGPGLYISMAGIGYTVAMSTLVDEGYIPNYYMQEYHINLSRAIFVVGWITFIIAYKSKAQRVT